MVSRIATESDARVLNVAYRMLPHGPIRSAVDDGVDGHDIDATVPGFGRMQLKSSVVKKVL